MATVSSLVSMGYSASSGSGVKSQIKEVQEELRALSKNKDVTSEERTKLQKEYQEKLDGLNSELTEEQDATLASIQNNAAALLGTSSGGGLFGGNTDNQSGLNVLLGSGATMASLKAVNSARVGIENRARTLTSEIRMDRIRGVNTSGKEEALSNLTANLTVMDTNLGNNIEKTLSKETSGKNANSSPIISQIKDQLAENQKSIEKDVSETYGSAEKQ